MSTPRMPNKRKRRLSPSEKYELRVGADRAGDAAGGRRQVRRGPLDGRARVPDRQAGRAGRAGCGVPGRPGVSREQVALAAAQVEIDRLRPTVTEQAVALHLHEGKARLGLTAGAVPPRVDAGVKAGLLGLLDHAEREAGSGHGPAGRSGWTRIGLPVGTSAEPLTGSMTYPREAVRCTVCWSWS